MPPPTPCPAIEELHHLAEGRLGRDEVERLACHLEACEHCVELAASVKVRDTLLDALCGSERLHFTPCERIGQLMSQWQVDTQATLARRSPADTADDIRSHLNPPKGPDELGRLGSYRILALLDQGGMGVVFRAEDAHLLRPAALKVMRPDLAFSPGGRERFLREARAAATLKHDHIVAVHQAGEERGLLYIAMELLDGEPLSRRLRREGKLPVTDVLRIGREMSEGLEAAHQRGLVHRDIKPSNTWLEALPDGERGATARPSRVKLLDFGLARLHGQGGGLTMPGAIVGTPPYMSPEQAGGEEVDPRSDLFSLGTVLYEICTGSLPFQGRNNMAILQALAVHTPPPVRQLNPEVPLALSQLVERLHAKEREKRPATAADVARALRDIENSHKPAPAEKGRWRLPAMAAVLLAVLLPLGYFFGITIFHIITDQGELIVEVEDNKDIEVKVVHGGGVFVHDRTGQREFTLTAGKGQIEVYEKDGFHLKTKEFTLSRGGKQYIKVTLKELELWRVKDAERQAAEYVLSIGGKVVVDGMQVYIDALAKLPKGPFRLVEVHLTNNRRLTDERLALFKNCKRLKYLNLYNAAATDVGLASFKDCEDLIHLDLSNTAVTDAGLASFKDRKNLTYLALSNTAVTDAGLAFFKDCKDLTSLYLSYTAVTDAGLAFFKDCGKLRHLSLAGAQIADAGLAHFQNCTHLDLLNLMQTRVTDSGLAHFKNCKKLANLWLGFTSHVTDAGLIHFKDCTNLRHIDLTATAVTDAGLAIFKECKNLKILMLRNTRVTDLGLANLKHWKNLTSLDLGFTGLTDAGLANLEDCKDLQQLRLNATPVSDSGLEILAVLPRLSELEVRHCRISLRHYEQFKVGLPNCKIDWIEPNRAAAEQVLALGGAVQVGFRGQEGRRINAGEPLPAAFFQLRRVALHDPKKPLEKLPDTLARLNFAEFDRLEAIELSAVPLQDIHFLLPIKAKLTELSLVGVGLVDENLAPLGKLTQLRKLVLDGNPISGHGLEKLNNLPALAELSVGCPTLAELFAGNIAALTRLKRLTLVGANFGDAGLRRLEGLTNLEFLDLRKTKVTAAGVANFRKALPKCVIEWDAGKEAREARAFGLSFRLLPIQGS